MRKKTLLFGATLVLAAYAFTRFSPFVRRYFFVEHWLAGYVAAAEPVDARQAFAARLAEAALEQTKHQVRYDPSYVRIPYPGGDVPQDTGVCSDVVIRAYRSLGIDLQERVHLDLKKNFKRYPQLWGLSGPDTNIDHRRVPNLMTYFSRHGTALPISTDPCAYLPGDVVAWDLGGGVTHIGIVAPSETACTNARPRIIHNIGSGPQLEDVLFSWRIIGHFRYGA